MRSEQETKVCGYSIVEAGYGIWGSLACGGKALIFSGIFKLSELALLVLPMIPSWS